MDTNDKNSGNKAKLISIFCLAVAIILVYILFSRLGELIGSVSVILAPILIGVFIAFLLNPVLVWLTAKFKPVFDKKTKWPERRRHKFVKTISITLTALFAVTLIVSIFLLIIPEFVASVMKLVDELDDYFLRLREWVKTLPADNVFSQSFDSLFDRVIQSLENWLTNDMPAMLTTAFNVAKESVTFLFNFFISIIVSIYVMKEKEKFIAGSKKITYALFSRARANDIISTARHGQKIFGQFLSGKIIEASLLGVLCFLFMSIFGMQYSLLISVIIAVCNIIPLFGPYIGAIPSFLILLMIDPSMAIGFGIMIIILQTVDANVFGPLIIGQKTGLSEFWITFALFLFGGVFGLAGMILGIPLMAVIFYLCRAFIGKRLSNKNLPNDNKTYLESDLLTEDGFTKLPNNTGGKQRTRTPLKEIFRRKKSGGSTSQGDDSDYSDFDI